MFVTSLKQVHFIIGHKMKSRFAKGLTSILTKNGFEMPMHRDGPQLSCKIFNMFQNGLNPIVKVH